jgi:transposase
MDTIYRRCAGLDVHKETVQVCVRLMDDSGLVTESIRRFGTTTRELLALYDWLSECQVTHVAMESTGVYWKPVWNILESGFELLLANARHIKNVPGRRTASGSPNCCSTDCSAPASCPARSNGSGAT